MTKTIKTPERKRKNRRIFLITILLFLIALISSWFMLDRWSKKYGFNGAGDFVKTVVVNYWTSFDAEYETIEITINDTDFLKLEKQREKHLENGIITKSSDRYVPAIISANGKKIKCKLRLKGHMTDHLQDEKWSFRIKTVGGDAFQGMKIFSLMHPGTRNYIYEWIYHQILSEEGIATVRYSFLNLKVNGSSWGIYAVEENFASELLGHHKLPKGPILGFNPDLYWYARLNEHEKKNVDLGDMNSWSASPEAYDEDENFKDKESQENYSEAIIKIEKFKRGELTTSETFDINKLAKFHAVLDLVGGQFSLDWSDVKYYYNPITRKLEPVGYESFSVRNTSILSGSSKFKNKHLNSAEWHERIFSDPKFFEKYVFHLKRISKKQYLNDFFDKYDSKLKNNLAILYSEFPYKKLEFTQYFVNQANIITLLNTPITTMVYLDKYKDNTLFLTVGNSSKLPLEINEIEIGEKKILLEEPLYFSAIGKSEHVYFESIEMTLRDSVSKRDLDKIKLISHYPGMNNSNSIEVKPIGLNSELLNEDFVNVTPNYKKFEFIKVDETIKRIDFLDGSFSISENLIIPEGFSVYASSGFAISLENNSAIVSFSPLNFEGTEESPILINSLDSTGKGIILLNCSNISNFQWVNFEDLNVNAKKKETYQAIITTYESPSRFINCIFSSHAKKAISHYKSLLTIQHSQFFKFEKTAVEIIYGEAKLNSIKFGKCNTAIYLNGSKGNFDNILMKNSEIGLRMSNGSNSKCKNWFIEDSGIGMYLTDLSELGIDKIRLRNIQVGFRAEKKSDVFGPSNIIVTNLTKANVKSVSQTDKKSKVIIK
jgi:hypothetical protein